jgi:hypothetical protein
VLGTCLLEDIWREPRRVHPLLLRAVRNAWDEIHLGRCSLQVGLSYHSLPLHFICCISTSTPLDQANQLKTRNTLTM